jgi:hypothetical protein
MPATKWIIGQGTHEWLPWRVPIVNDFFTGPHTFPSEAQGYFGPGDINTIVDLVYRTRTWRMDVNFENDDRPSQTNGTYIFPVYERKKLFSPTIPSIPDETYINGVDLSDNRSPLSRFHTASELLINELYIFPSSPGPYQQLGPVIYRNGNDDGLNRGVGYYIRAGFSLVDLLAGLFSSFNPSPDTSRLSAATLKLQTIGGGELEMPLYELASGPNVHTPWVGTCVIRQNTLWPYA